MILMNKAVRNFFLSFIIALGLTFLLKVPEFTDSQIYTLFLVFFSIGLWITEAIPPFSVGLLIIAYLVFTLGNEHFNSAPENIEKYAQTFSSKVIWLLLGGFFLASAMTKTKLDQALLRFTLKVSGTKPQGLLIGLMMTTTVASMLLSNTATTAMVIAAITPLLGSLEKDSKVSKALLLGIPISATIGGMGTIIGTPSNAIAVGLLEQEGIVISFMEWMKYGVPLTLILTVVSSFALIRIFLKNNDAISVAFLQNTTPNLPKNALNQQRIVIVILIFTVGLWLTTSLHGLTVASVCAIPLVFLTLFGILDSNDIRKLPWDTLFLVAGGLSLGLALEQTGLLYYYSGKLVEMNMNHTLLLVIFAYITMLVSNIISNTAASALLIPLGLAIMGDYKVAVALIIAISSSTSMFLPVSTPPNAVAYGTGLLEQKDFRIGGILVGVLGPALAILWVLVLS